MGRIKTKGIKRTALGLFAKDQDLFSEDFQENKTIIKEAIPGKKSRNQVAGYLSRLKRNNKRILSENE